MKSCLAWLCVLVVGAGAVAQDRQQAELGTVQNQLRQNRAEVDRLLEMRLRHDFGLPGDERDDRTFRSAVPSTTEAIERMHKEAEDEKSAAAILNAEYERLRAAVEQLKSATAARMQAEAAEHPPEVVPQAGVALPQANGNPATGGGAEARRGQGVAGGSSSEDEAGLPLAMSLGPIVTQIHGSTDHQRVAQALFRAGQELMRVAATARAQGHTKIAKELDDRGRDKLVRVATELESLLAEKEPSFAALFYLGRSRELLFRHAELHERLSPSSASREYSRREQEVREPFLAITARDIVKTGARSDVDVLGQWGKAAQTALTNFSWTNQHAAYDAMPSIKALTWPGER